MNFHNSRPQSSILNLEGISRASQHKPIAGVGLPHIPF